MPLKELFAFSLQNNASDLHLSAGLPPLIRVEGVLRRTDFPELKAEELSLLLHDSMNEEQRKRFAADLETDFSLEITGLGRFRANVFQQDRGPAAVFRIIPTTILSLQQLGLPSIVTQLALRRSGLMLVTGPTGSGKTTTLAAIVDYMNDNRSDHILTIEDPIEFIHHSKRCLINQREVMRDTRGFNQALRAALREDPDVILIGELRDLETMRLALSAAETGHLVLATLHTHSATQTIHRMVDVFPTAEKALVRSQLAGSLNAIIAQSLVPQKGGGRITALELMVCNAALRHLIREDKITQMVSVLQTGRHEGMFTLDQHLEELVKTNVVSVETAQQYAVEKNKFL